MFLLPGDLYVGSDVLKQYEIGPSYAPAEHFFCQFHQASLIHLAWTRFATRRFTWASGAQGLLANPLDVSGYLSLCLQASHWHALTFPGASMAITFMHNADAHCKWFVSGFSMVWVKHHWMHRMPMSRRNIPVRHRHAAEIYGPVAAKSFEARGAGQNPAEG